MRTISLWQPWASLWCSERKVHETRHWSIQHRGWLVVHAARRLETLEPDDPIYEILEDEFGGHWAMDLPRGVLIGMVNIVSCKRTEDVFGPRDTWSLAQQEDYECGDFSPDRFAWERHEFRRFDQPIPYRGQQGLFSVPNAVLPLAA